MRITNSAISLGSQHVLTRNYAQTDFLTVLKGNQEIVNQNLQASRSIIREIYGELTYLSVRTINTVGNLRSVQYKPDQPLLPDLEQQKLKIIERIVFLLTGKRIRFWINPNTNSALTNGFNPEENLLSNGSTDAESGWGGSFFERKRLYEESESLAFHAKGIINTSDGKSINFNTQVNLSRQFTASNDLNGGPGNAFIDPLVINYNDTAASLTSTKFSFDLDVDGAAEQISFLGEGSGFLALDLNNDNKINDGSELFGPVSQNGFTELAKYDADKNDWIDENDPIYDRLRIWTKDQSGKDSLFALGQKGIGAVYLGNVNANFSLNDQNNNSLGQMQKMGLFVKEDGKVGTLQQINLVV